MEKATGEVVIRCIIEIAGFPKEHVKESAKNLLGKIKELKDVKVGNIETAELKEIKEMWSTFIEIEIEFAKLESMIAFCFNFMPSSIEILKPVRFNLEAGELEGYMNEILRRLHNFSMTITNLAIKKKVLEKRLATNQKE